MKGITRIDVPVLILGFEMEFHYHSLVPIMSADSHFRLPNKRLSNETTASGNSKSISYCDVNKAETYTVLYTELLQTTVPVYMYVAVLYLPQLTKCIGGSGGKYCVQMGW